MILGMTWWKPAELRSTEWEIIYSVDLIFIFIVSFFLKKYWSCVSSTCENFVMIGVQYRIKGEPKNIITKPADKNFV